MKVYRNPARQDWQDLVLRPTHDRMLIDAQVKNIMQAVASNGDAAVAAFTRTFDDVDMTQFAHRIASPPTIKHALAEGIRMAKDNITRFHGAQHLSERVVETQPGVRCWRKAVPIEKVGLYIPGGSAPLFSSLLMLAIPAQLAGCQQIVVCTPPGPDGSVHPLTAYTAHLLGIDTVYCVGGAQAIAAMTYGTETIPAVDKIFGPGNAYVTEAKMQAMVSGVAIDMPAGPSELLVIADASARPAFVAADLLSQAEHGSDSQVVLVTDSWPLLEQVRVALAAQLAPLPRQHIAAAALQNSLAVCVQDLQDAIAFSNLYAPEHLIIATEEPGQWVDQIRHAGSVFLGHYSCESAGDYASGPNHTLPTNAFARNYSGISVESFIRYITFQELSVDGLRKIGPAVTAMAEAEGLTGHARAVSIRLKSMSND